MGPTILLMPSVLRQDLRRGRSRPQGRTRPDPARPPVAVVLRRRLGRSTFTPTSDAMAATLDAFAPGGAASAGYRGFLDFSARLDDISRRYFFWRSIGSVRDMFDPSTTFNLSSLGDVIGMRPWSTVGATIRRVRARPPRRADARPLHAVRRLGPRSVAGRPLRNRPDADRRGRLVSPGRHPRRGRGLDPTGRRSGRRVRRSARRSNRSPPTAGGRVSGVDLDDGRRVPLAAVVSNSDAVRTHRELLAGRPGGRRSSKRRRSYEPACSGVVLYLGLDRRYEHLLHHNFVFSRDPHEEFDFIYRKGEPAPDPHLLRLRPGRHRTRRRARGRRGPLRPGPHALPSLSPRLGRAAIRPTAARSSTSSRRRPGWRTSKAHIKIERRSDAARYPRSLPRTRRRDLRPGEPRSVQRRVQAGQPQPGRPGALPRGRRGHPGPGMPMVLMSGWIAADALDQDGLVERRDAAQFRD